MNPSRWTLAATVTLLAIALVVSACAPSTPQAPAAPAAKAPAAPAAKAPAAPAAKAPAAPAPAAPAPAAKAPAAPAGGGTITVGIPQDAKTLDPALGSDLYSLQSVNSIFSSLVYVDFEGNIKPGLAKSWQVSGDGLTWDFTLVDNVKFHDGSKLKASDVIFSFERHKDPALKSTFVARVENVESMKAVDDTHVQMKLAKPAAPFLYDVSTILIVPKAAVEALGKDFGKKPVGSGPYKFVSRLEGDRITLERFNDFFGGVPKLAKVVVRVIPEAGVRLIELETGGVDIITDVPARDMPGVESNPKLAVSKTPGTNYRFWSLNMKKPPLDNLKVRQAMAHAVDRQKMIDVIYPGLAVPAVGPFPPVAFAYDPSYKGIQHDPARAKQLLAEAGFAKGFEIEALVPNDDNQGKEAALLVEQLAAVGITVKMKTLDFATVLDAMRKGNFEMARMGLTPSPDPDSYVNLPFGTSDSTMRNYSSYSNAKADALIKQGASTMDQNQRKEIYKELQKILVEEAPMLFIFHEFRAVAYNKKVQGFKAHPTGYVLFTTPFGADVSIGN